MRRMAQERPFAAVGRAGHGLHQHHIGAELGEQYSAVLLAAMAEGENPYALHRPRGDQGAHVWWRWRPKVPQIVGGKPLRRQAGGRQNQSIYRYFYGHL